MNYPNVKIQTYKALVTRTTMVGGKNVIWHSQEERFYANPHSPEHIFSKRTQVHKGHLGLHKYWVIDYAEAFTELEATKFSEIPHAEYFHKKIQEEYEVRMFYQADLVKRKEEVRLDLVASRSTIKVEELGISVADYWEGRVGSIKEEQLQKDPEHYEQQREIIHNDLLEFEKRLRYLELVLDIQKPSIL